MFLRAVIVLLACMNVGVAIWWATHRSSPVKLLPATDPGVGSLVLLSESEPRPFPESAELSVDPQATDPTAACMSIGPFASPADLRRAMNSLLPRVERIQFREVESVALRGYRVYLPAAGSRELALQTARTLSGNGITDYYVVTAGEQQNTISLGIFKELENAKKRHDVVAALGFNPTIETRTEQAPQWWIDLAASAGFNWQALVPDAALKAVSVPCAANAGQTPASTPATGDAAIPKTRPAR